MQKPLLPCGGSGFFTGRPDQKSTRLTPMLSTVRLRL